MAKEYFKAQGVEFVNYNVAEDAEKREEMLEKTGQMGVPVIQIGDDIVIGFNKPVIDQLLGISA
jgi:glutaredoxin 3